MRFYDPGREDRFRYEWTRLPALEHGRRLWGDPMNCALLRIALAAPLVVTAASGQIYDLLLKNGHVVDPANKRNGRLDIAVVGNKIVQIGSDLPAAHARVVVDAGQYYVTPGLIDIHTHFDSQGAYLNLQADHNALPNGVTTAVDAGSSGWKNFEAFKTKVIDQSKTRLLAFLNIVVAGLYGPEVEK